MIRSMRPLIFAVTLLALIPSHAAADLNEVLTVQNYTLLGHAAKRLCLSSDGSCSSLGVQPENHQQFAVVGNGENVQGDVVQLSSRPNDSRALACWNALATDAVMQACAYGTNYPEHLNGVPLAGKAKFAGYNGAVFGTYTGRMYIVAAGEHVATFDRTGFGFGGLGRSGRNTFTLGWGELPNSVPDGEIAFAAVRTGSVMHLWYKLSDGTTGCLTCPPSKE